MCSSNSNPGHRNNRTFPARYHTVCQQTNNTTTSTGTTSQRTNNSINAHGAAQHTKPSGNSHDSAHLPRIREQFPPISRHTMRSWMHSYLRCHRCHGQQGRDTSIARATKQATFMDGEHGQHSNNINIKPICPDRKPSAQQSHNAGNSRLAFTNSKQCNGHNNKQCH